MLRLHRFLVPLLPKTHHRVDKFTADTRRYQYAERPSVIDLGLRLDAAQAMGLESEQVSYGKDTDPRASLRRCGATAAECSFLVHPRRWEGDACEGARIELNAMTSAQFLRWLEEGLRAAGVTKVVPDPETLAQAYTYQQQVRTLQAAIERALKASPAAMAPPPADLAERVRERITDTDLPWDEGLWEILGEDESEDADDGADAQRDAEEA